jgi:ribosomal protein L40E
MALSEARGRSHLVCGQCQALVVWPKDLLAEAKAAIAQAARRDPPAAAQLLQSRYGLDLREGKTLVVHVTRTSGICHRCNSPLEGGETNCPKCHAANLNW